jgi:hypothetical protein
MAAAVGGGVGPGLVAAPAGVPAAAASRPASVAHAPIRPIRVGLVVTLIMVRSA